MLCASVDGKRDERSAPQHGIGRHQPPTVVVVVALALATPLQQYTASARVVPQELYTIRFKSNG